MKFVVTGGSGFIGTHLVEELIKQQHEVLNIDVNPPLLESQMTFWKKRDILDKEGLINDFQCFAPEYVIHLAAKTDTLSDKLEDYRVNTEGTDNVLAAIKVSTPVRRLILCSTQFVNQYHGAPKNDLDFAPHTVYGQTKVMNENAVRASGLDCLWTIIRPTNIWGPWHPRYAQEFWRILSKGLYLHPGGGKVMRSYGYVKNVVYQISEIAKAEPDLVDKKVYYVGDKPIDLLDWVNGFSKGLTGRKVKIIPRFLLRLIALTGDTLSLVHIKFPITSSRYKSMTTSNDAPMDPVFRAFGQPPYSLEEGIEETIEWLKERPEYQRLSKLS